MVLPSPNVQALPLADHAERPNILSELLGSLSLGTFFQDYYLRNPLLLRDSCTGMVPSDGRDLLVSLLAKEKSDVFVGRIASPFPGSAPRTIEEIEKVLGLGYTISVRHVELEDTALAEVADRFQRVLGGEVDVHLYWTPRDSPGFGWHYDAEEVFVMQIDGEKEWSIRQNTVNPFPLYEDMPDDQRFEREVSPTSRCTLRRGDCLYVPGGFWHSTAAGGESISMSIGVKALTALDVFDSLRSGLMKSILWRQRLNPGSQSDSETVPSEFRALCEELAADFAKLLRSRFYFTSSFGKQQSLSPRND